MIQNGRNDFTKKLKVDIYIDGPREITLKDSIAQDN